MAKLKKVDTVEKATKFVYDLYEGTYVTEEDMYIRLSEGNSKLQGILNFSIPAIITCPYATELCITNCYVHNSYSRFKEHTMLGQKVNYELSQSDKFVPMMIEAIEAQLARPKYKNKHVEFRIHVSGDFYSPEYLAKWIAITDYFRGRNISFGCYTKSIPFIKSYLKNTGYTLSSININFMASIWADTKPNLLKMIDELNMNTFSAFDAKNEAQPENTIRCQDDVENKACGRTCNLCYEKDKNNLLTDKFDSLIDLAQGRKHVVIGIH